MERVQFLGAHPMTGHMVREFKDRSIREIAFGPYRIIHRITAMELQIVRIFHGKRELRRKHLE
ncbi:MAG: type II toxin-antitoxin system RelE/ParE family toxin [Flavobacteriales bacterium]|nr:type II toxin-antitoxin system RelE/ParE family toxin [Flavobacteriales bacterium]